MLNLRAPVRTDDQLIALSASNCRRIAPLARAELSRRMCERLAASLASQQTGGEGGSNVQT